MALIIILGLVANNKFITDVDAQTLVEGHITQDTTWTIENSPYIITNHVFVDPGVTLSIEPGVEIMFNGSFMLHVEGSLYAVGEESKMIRFTSNKTEPTPGNWLGISLAASWWPGAQAHFTLKHCIIEYAEYGVYISSYAEAIVEKSLIMNNSESGIEFYGECNALIKESTIAFNKNGISSWRTSQSSGISIIDNSIHSNSENGIYIQSGGSVSNYIHNITISNNLISSNDRHGIFLYSSAYETNYNHAQIYNVTIFNNTVSLNGENGIYLYSYGYKHRFATFDVTLGYGYINDVVISDNKAISNGKTGIYLHSYGYGWGSYREWEGLGYIYDVVVSGNNASNNNADGISLYSYGKNVGRIYSTRLSDNTILSNGGNGIYLYSYSDADDNYIYNVTVSGNSVLSNSENGIALSSNADSEDSYIHDIIFSYNEAISNGKNGIYLYGEGYGSTYIYNVMFSSTKALSNNESGIYLHINGRWNSYIYGASFLNSTLSRNYRGIYLYSYSYAYFAGIRSGHSYIYDVVVSGNNASNNIDGISLYSYGYINGYIYSTRLSDNTLSSNILNAINLHAKNHYRSVSFDVTILDNVIVENSVGIYVSGAIKTNTIYNSILSNIYGILYAETTGNIAHYNDISYNVYGMNVTYDATVNAEYNYWGDPTGPYHISLNPDGKGNPVNGNGIDLDFIPFLPTLARIELKGIGYERWNTIHVPFSVEEAKQYIENYPPLTEQDFGNIPISVELENIGVMETTNVTIDATIKGDVLLCLLDLDNAHEDKFVSDHFQYDITLYTGGTIEVGQSLILNLEIPVKYASVIVGTIKIVVDSITGETQILDLLMTMVSLSITLYIKGNNLDEIEYKIPEDIHGIADPESLLEKYNEALSSRIREKELQIFLKKYYTEVLHLEPAMEIIPDIPTGTTKTYFTIIDPGTTKLIISLAIPVGVTLVGLSLLPWGATTPVGGTLVAAGLAMLVLPSPTPGNATITVATASQPLDMSLQIVEMIPTNVKKIAHNVFVNGEAFDVITVSNSTISKFEFFNGSIGFTVTDGDSSGFCHATIPKVLMANVTLLYINDEPITDFILSENATHTVIYFSYDHPSDIVVIPEFPRLLILPIFMVLTIAAIIIYYKNRRET